MRHQPRSTLFPYTTLFRSGAGTSTVAGSAAVRPDVGNRGSALGAFTMCCAAGLGGGAIADADVEGSLAPVETRGSRFRSATPSGENSMTRVPRALSDSRCSIVASRSSAYISAIESHRNETQPERTEKLQSTSLERGRAPQNLRAKSVRSTRIVLRKKSLAMKYLVFTGPFFAWHWR